MRLAHPSIPRFGIHAVSSLEAGVRLSKLSETCNLEGTVSGVKTRVNALAYDERGAYETLLPDSVPLNSVFDVPPNLTFAAMHISYPLLFPRSCPNRG